MKPYYILIIYWILIYSIFSLKKSKLNRSAKKYYVFFASLGLFIIMGFKHPSVGADTWNYIRVFLQGADIPYKSTEVGFYYFRILLLGLGFTPQLFLIVVSLIVTFTFADFIFRYSDNVFLSFFLHLTIGLFAMSMSGIRQILAVCLVVYSIRYVLEHKPIKFVLLVIFASTFHQTALISLPIYLMNKYIKITKKNGIAYLLVLLMVAIFRNQLFELTQYILPNQYDIYYNSSYIRNMSLAPILVATAIPIVAYFYWNSSLFDESSKKRYQLMLMLSYLNALLMIMASQASIGDRFGYYFAYANLILIPNTIENIKNPYTRLLGRVVAFLLPLVQFIMVTPNGTMQIGKYIFFWQ